MIVEDRHRQSRDRARVCIVTPGQIGSNPRVVKEAQALHDAGIDVTVIATRVLDVVEPRDQALMQCVGWTLKRVDLRGRFAWRARRIAQIAAQCGFAATRISRLADFGFSPFSSALFFAAMSTTASLYVAHYPAALPVVAAASRRHNALYAYDAEDFHLGDLPDRAEFDSQRRRIRAIEGRYLPAAAYVTAASPDIAQAYIESYGIAPPTVVLNVFPRAEAPARATGCGAARPGPSLYWFSQTIGPHRGLECALRAIAAANSRPHLYLRGHFAAGYEERLDALARTLGCCERLHFLDPASPSEMVQFAAQFDVGLASEIGHTPNSNRALSNKLFTYLLAGLPVLVSDTPAQARFAFGKEACLSLYAADDHRALALALDGLLLDPERLAQARRASFRLGQSRYNWDIESDAFLELIRRILARREPKRSAA